MKLHSITTQFLNSSNLQESTSCTSFKDKPYVANRFDVFCNEIVEKSVHAHLKIPAYRYIVSVRTTMGTYIKTFKGDQ